MRTLIVEDDLASQMLLNKFFSTFGVVVVAENGEEGVAAFLNSLENSTPFDLICLDIMMPIMDGQSALKLIRQIEIEKGIPVEQQIRVIMTTALDDPENIRESYVEGSATSYITKPVNFLMLKMLLQQLGFSLRS